MGLAAENVADLYLLDRIPLLIDALAQDLCSPARRDHMIFLDKNIAVPVLDVLTGISACDPVLQSLDRLLAVHERCHFHTRYEILALTAVDLADDQFLADIDHSACQISGVGGSQRRIGHTLPRAVR